MTTCEPHPPQGDPRRLSAGQCATLACLLEATAPKPGNVHRGADFEDVTFVDFAVSAVAIGPAMEAAVHRGVGETALAAVKATQRLTQTNTNLGAILLLAPLAAVPRDRALSDGAPAVLAQLDARDARQVYEAIRLAKPGGLGKVRAMDVHDDPPRDLLAAMRLAAERDLVARQYTENFAQVFQLVTPRLVACLSDGWTLTQTIIHTHVWLLSRFRDSLIARKCGAEIADLASQKAAAVIRAGGPGDETYVRALADLDFWLRSDGHARNPGAIADLVAAGLFTALREGLINAPLR